jgi:hypothetical protein
MDDDVLIGAGTDPRLEHLADGDVVAFQADGTGDPPGTAWSVTVTGYAHPVDDPARLDRLSGTDPDTPRKLAAPVLRITTTVVGGRMFPRAAPGGPPLPGLGTAPGV